MNRAGRIVALAGAYEAARDAVRDAVRASQRALAPLLELDPPPSEATFAAARVAAGLPTAREEAELHAAMLAARDALADALRRAARDAGAPYPPSASSSEVADTATERIAVARAVVGALAELRPFAARRA